MSERDIPLNMSVCASKGPLPDRFRLGSGPILARFIAGSGPVPARNRAGTGSKGGGRERSYMEYKYTYITCVIGFIRYNCFSGLLLAKSFIFCQYIGLLDLLLAITFYQYNVLVFLVCPLVCIWPDKFQTL